MVQSMVDELFQNGKLDSQVQSGLGALSPAQAKAAAAMGVAPSQ